MKFLFLMASLTALSTGFAQQNDEEFGPWHPASQYQVVTENQYIKAGMVYGHGMPIPTHEEVREVATPKCRKIAYERQDVISFRVKTYMRTVPRPVCQFQVLQKLF